MDAHKIVDMRTITVIPQRRKDLAKLFNGVGVEVGVERGIFSKYIAKTAAKLYCVDAWRADLGYANYVTQSRVDSFYEETKERLGNFHCEIIRKLSMDAVRDFEDESLDFVYIDAHHQYEYVRDDIRAWSKKVKEGGIISGHDYIEGTRNGYVFGVIEAVNELNADVTIWNGDRFPSWSYIKK